MCPAANSINSVRYTNQRDLSKHGASLFPVFCGVMKMAAKCRTMQSLIRVIGRERDRLLNQSSLFMRKP